MLNHIFVPNTLVCIEPGGAIDWEKLIPYIWENLNYDEGLVNETVQYNQLRGPYVEVQDVNDLQLVHQYYITTTAITAPPVTAPANSIVLVYSKNEQGLVYLILTRSQIYFQYTPIEATPYYTYTYSPYDPNVDKVYLRPYGEWPVSSTRYIQFTDIRKDISDLIKYRFDATLNGTLYHMTAPVYFPADKVNVRLYLSTDNGYEHILTCPAHYEITFNDQTGQRRIYLVIDAYCSLPPVFYVEVF